MKRTRKVPAGQRHSSSALRGKRKAVLVRMPPETLEAIDALAKAGYRSRNRQIVVLVEFALDFDHDAILAHRAAKANERTQGGKA